MFLLSESEKKLINRREKVREEYKEKCGRYPPVYFNLRQMTILSMLKIRRNLVNEGVLDMQGKYTGGVTMHTLEDLKKLAEPEQDFHKND